MVPNRAGNCGFGVFRTFGKVNKYNMSAQDVKTVDNCYQKE